MRERRETAASCLHHQFLSCTGGKGEGGKGGGEREIRKRVKEVMGLVVLIVI